MRSAVITLPRGTQSYLIANHPSSTWTATAAKECIRFCVPRVDLNNVSKPQDDHVPHDAMLRAMG